MTCRSDLHRLRRPGPLLAAVLLIAAPALAVSERSGVAYREALVALSRGDGIAAEVALRKAEAAGMDRSALAARMGEALIDQGDLRKAREWLGPARFAPADAAHGWRMLGRLEMAEGHLPAAGRAFDQALTITPRDSRLWVDIARLRYQGGEHTGAIAAAEQAVNFDPENVRAIELRGLMVRDSYGLPAALPWFEGGLKRRPDDVPLLLEYAATLGDLGRAQDMLTVTRRVIALDDRNPRGFLLQAVLAARAGQTELARHLVERAGRRALDRPGGLLLSGLLELEAGNAHLAVEQLDRLVRFQPDNAPARLLLARALAAAGNDDELVARFGAEAATAGASPYLKTLVARAHENRGERDQAAPLLDAAARTVTVPLVLLPGAPDAGPGPAGAVRRARAMAAAENVAGAGTVAGAAQAALPGSAVTRLLAGDVQALRGDCAGALAHYRQVAEVRMTDGLVLRVIGCLQRMGQGGAIAPFVARLRVARPRDPLLLWIEAGLTAERGDWSAATDRLTYLSRSGLGRDAALQRDLARAAARTKRPEVARQAGLAASELLPLAGDSRSPEQR